MAQRRRQDSNPERIFIVAAAGALAVAVIDRLRKKRAARSSAHPIHHCECGREYEVHGKDSHRIFWPRGGSQRDAVLGDDCPACGRSLAAAAPA